MVLSFNISHCHYNTMQVLPCFPLKLLFSYMLDLFFVSWLNGMLGYLFTLDSHAHACANRLT